MTELDILIDGALREHAIDAADRYVRQNPECDVNRAQITGLRQLAGMEPRRVSGFAAKQRERAQTRAAGSNNPRHAREAAFWDLVHKLCISGVTKDLPWTLHASCADALKKANPPSSKERQQFKERWIDGHYPPFFQAFCIHYLYRQAEGSGPGEDDRD